MSIDVEACYYRIPSPEVNCSQYTSDQPKLCERLQVEGDDDLVSGEELHQHLLQLLCDERCPHQDQLLHLLLQPDPLQHVKEAATMLATVLQVWHDWMTNKVHHYY